MRFYSFVANLYLSPLQHGLQTGHAISEMYAHLYSKVTNADRPVHRDVYHDWALNHKTIIICAAINSRGVLNAYEQAEAFGAALCLPSVIFHEDQDSLNGAPTAAGIVVPAKFYEAVREDYNDKQEFPAYTFTVQDFDYEHVTRFEANTPESQFITWLKSYRLA